MSDRDSIYSMHCADSLGAQCHMQRLRENRENGVYKDQGRRERAAGELGRRDEPQSQFGQLWQWLKKCTK